MTSLPTIAAAFGLLLGTANLAMAGPTLPLSREFADTTKEEVWEAVVTALAANDLPIVQKSYDRGKIQARQTLYLNGHWADCILDTGRIFDPNHPRNINVRTWNRYRGTDIRVAIEETGDGAVRLSIDPHFYTQESDSRHREYAYQVPCQSTGQLEQAMLTAPVVFGPTEDGDAPSAE
jgi:hypothetical protein